MDAAGELMYESAVEALRMALEQRGSGDLGIFEALGAVYRAGVGAGHRPLAIRGHALSLVRQQYPDDWSLKARVLVELHRCAGEQEPVDGALDPTR